MSVVCQSYCSSISPYLTRGLLEWRDIPGRRIDYGALMGESIESKLATVGTIYIEYVKYESRNRLRAKTYSQTRQYHGRPCR